MSSWPAVFGLSNALFSVLKQSSSIKINLLSTVYASTFHVGLIYFFLDVMQKHSKWSISVIVPTPVSPLNYIQVVFQHILYSFLLVSK